MIHYRQKLRLILKAAVGLAKMGDLKQSQMKTVFIVWEETYVFSSAPVETTLNTESAQS